MALYNIGPGTYLGQDFSMASSLEASPGTTATSTLYSYVVCLDLR